MADPPKTLFAPVVPAAKLNPLFEAIRTKPASGPARWMLDDVYQTFNDPEGNFLEQLQTGGFNARFFELYLFAYLSRSGFAVERSTPNPDFLVERHGISVAIEATTVNPSTSGALATAGSDIRELDEAGLHTYLRDELAIRFGSPLLSKLEKRYWELPQCKGLPFVIAIEAFHDVESLSLSDWSLARYLYGIEQFAAWDDGGVLRVSSAPVLDHAVEKKRIPSGFFGCTGAEYISAVLFTNSGTYAKFSRMAYQHGVGCDELTMVRTGYSHNPDPDAMDPTFFSYNLDEPPFVESWGQGLVVLHNPRAYRPVPSDFFVDAVQGHLQDGLFTTERSSWHPIASKTITIHMGDVKAKLRSLLPSHARAAVAAIAKGRFEKMCGFCLAELEPTLEEHGWFADETESFLGVVVRNRRDENWGYAILARDKFFRFTVVSSCSDCATRFRARADLQQAILRLLLSPKRIYF